MMIPASLRAERRWIVAKLETVNGRLTKVPYCAFDVSRKASSVDPGTWSDFETAFRASREHGVMLGFVLGSGFVGVDLDRCVTNGIVEPWAVKVIDVIDSYAEFSVSGTGVHILCRGSLPAGDRRTGKAGKYPPVPAGSELEAYDDGRYFVVTGDAIRESALEDRTDVLAAVHRAIFGISTRALYERERDARLAALGIVDPNNDRRGTENITEADLPRTFSDAEILTFAPNAANGDKFVSLFRGDLSAYCGDHSSADLALASILMFWTRGDREQADRLFRLSKLNRPKWTNRADYRRRTFDKADQS